MDPAVLFGGLIVKNACLVDTPADYFHSGFHITGHRLTCEGRSIQSRCSLDNLAIQREHAHRVLRLSYPLDIYLVRVNLFQFSVPFYIRIVRTNVH